MQTVLPHILSMTQIITETKTVEAQNSSIFEYNI